MRRLLILTLALPLLACGGDHNDGGVGCTADYVTTPNAAFAGPYTATYTPNGGAVGGSLAFTLNVAADGTVSGTASNPSIAPGDSTGGSGTVTGTALDVKNGCTKTTALALTFIFGNAEAQSLTVAKGQNDSVVGTFQGTLTQSGGTVSVGKLVVKVSTPIE